MFDMDVAEIDTLGTCYHTSVTGNVHETYVRTGLSVARLHQVQSAGTLQGSSPLFQNKQRNMNAHFLTKSVSETRCHVCQLHFE
mmetsp:Transcript_2541/g.5979  ORF Transcript_2541/g.5979 Transcript_2541/m.5979 type:complete len:84 (-) Transcript_2541:167-418(-)